MGYHDLSECTLSHAERVEEAGRIIEMLQPVYDLLNEKEAAFIESIGHTVSVKQLFWLRDIKNKYL